MNIKLLIAGSLLALSSSANAAIATFDNLALAPESFFFPGQSTSFNSGSASFEHNCAFYNGDPTCYWNGFTYSNTTDTTTAGFTNQYSAITGSGVSDSSNYGISNVSGASRINFSEATSVNGAYFTNTTYSFLAVRDGNDGAGFVKGPFTENDYFRLTINGLDSNGSAISTMEISLAEGTNILDDWMWSDMSSLGSVYGLEFSMYSSDTGPFGMNTPAYFAIDNLTTETTVVPLPAAAWLFLSGLLTLIGSSKLRRKH